MRTQLLISALTLGVIASSAAAQTPSTASPAAPAPSAPARTDSAKPPRTSPVYLVLMLEGHGGRIITGESGSGDEAREGLGGFDFSIQSSRRAGVGVALRSLGGPYEYADLALLLGNRAFSIDVGAASRTGHNEFTAQPNDTTYRFAHLGFRSRANLGNTDFSVTMRVLGYIKLPTPEEKAFPSDLSGFSAESGLAWTYVKWRVPWTLQMGYRLERFTVFGVEQESSSLSIGGGVVLGRR